MSSHVTIPIGANDRRTRFRLRRRARSLKPHRLLIAPTPAIPIAIIQRTQRVIGPQRIQIQSTTRQLPVLHLQHQIAIYRIDKRPAASLSKHALAQHSRLANNVQRRIEQTKPVSRDYRNHETQLQRQLKRKCAVARLSAREDQHISERTTAQPDQSSQNQPAHYRQ